jgi:hypothetical protein
MIRYSRLSFRSWLRQNRPPYLHKQFLASARFSLNQHSGGGRRDSLKLLNNDFKGGTVANDVVELAIPVVLTAGSNSFEGSHNNPPLKRLYSVLAFISQGYSNTLE